jgi:hypothetical protein
MFVMGTSKGISNIDSGCEGFGEEVKSEIERLVLRRGE